MKPAWLRTAVPGFLLGLTVTRLGFTDYAELRRMLLFRDLRLLLAFAVAVVLLIVVFAALRNRLDLGKVVFHRGLVPGAFAFGVGWAMTGACPGVVIAQLGMGIGPAVVSYLGIVVGARFAARLRVAAAPVYGGPRVVGGDCASVD